ncbi:hypothetical protein Pint_11494 [Pistacia integerrima]|uniref:Uncharacterized protein n=1 Tax=Pistacia integerrima TaxID=434235 RepID=A0ACC0XFG7_9ROSI|nr:hypothetical protein Pint_11494 [Pistacia integerrima]
MFSVLANILPGLYCLQRNLPCNKNALCYSSFAIKCGGEEMKVDIIVCEADSYDLVELLVLYLIPKNWHLVMRARSFISLQGNPRDYLDSMDLVWRMDFTWNSPVKRF